MGGVKMHKIYNILKAFLQKKAFLVNNKLLN